MGSERDPRVARKRYRRRTAKPGELLAYWGKLPGDSPDVVYAWGGSGANKCDGSLLHGMFNGFEHRKHGKLPAANDGYLKELEARGYDITTLRFSIRKKSATAEVLKRGDDPAPTGEVKDAGR